MKKLLSSVLALTVFASSCAYAKYSDVPPSEDYYLSSTRLADLGIISGYEDGTFRPDNTITRAEFTKIVVCMMDKEKEAKASTNLTGFFDVDVASWHTHYIRYAVSRDILSGYADGSFRPDNTISVCEAVTILLRTLGYTEDEVGYYWPDNYISAAASLGFTAGIDLAPHEALTRKSAAVLVDRALFAKPSASLSPANTYIETTGYTVLEDSLILDNDLSSDSVTVLSGNLKKNTASAYLSKTQFSVASGDVYNYAVIDKNGYLVTVREYESGEKLCSVSGVLNKFTDNNIEYTTVDGLKGSYNADDSFVIYYGSDRLTPQQAKSRISNGTDITFYGNSYGLWNIAVIGSSERLTPIMASKNYTDSDGYLGNIPINPNNLTVYRNGEASKLSEIKAGDVVYYNTKTNVMDVYAKKVTGTYYSAYPSKAYVESVSVGGKEYEIGNSSATDRLNASEGAFDIGDKITLLLGKNDKIAFVTDNAQGFDYSAYGVVIKSESRIAQDGENKGSTEFVTTLFMSDGEEHDIVTDKLYKDSIGKFVSINYKNSLAYLMNRVSVTKDDYAGKIDKSSRTVNTRYVLKDAAIIQRISDENTAVASCELLDFDKLTASKISEDNIINAVSGNSFGDIAILYVNGLENTNSFGVIAGFVKNNNSTVGYKILSNGYQESYNLSAASISTSVGAGVEFKAQNGVISKIYPMRKIASAASVKAVEGGRIYIGGKIYKLADDVQIADISDTSKIKSVTIDDLAENLSASVVLYSDKADGVIRVITMKK
ncbi:MAG: S-layer homology domain-containing protein [Firmicutes bacterium]|nr:S-layer homology domain-containing protein [Bacillota bacterium]